MKNKFQLYQLIHRQSKFQSLNNSIRLPKHPPTSKVVFLRRIQRLNTHNKLIKIIINPKPQIKMISNFNKLKKISKRKIKFFQVKTISLM